MNTVESTSSLSSVGSAYDTDDSTYLNVPAMDIKDISPPSTSAGKARSAASGSAHSGEGVRVVCRFRPQSQMEAAAGGKVCVSVVSDARVLVGHGDGDTQSSYEFDRTFDMDAGQDEVFDYIGGPILNGILNGVNASIIAYGQTGSGKTFTMQGPDFDERGDLENAWTSEPEKKGIVPRVIEGLFNRISNAPPHEEYAVVTSFVEVYRENIYDLLTPSKDNLIIRQDQTRGLWLPDATETPVNSLREVMAVMKTGIQHRKKAATKMNIESSRSHSIFLVTVCKRDLIEKADSRSQLYLVDLAGSERVGKTGTTGQTLQEAMTINKSLLALRQVIHALVTRKNGHIPYRDSKLTRLLQNSLGGNAMTTLIVNCSPSTCNYQETISTLRFGEWTRRIKNKPKQNKQKSIAELTRLLEVAKSEIASQREYISRLESELRVFRNIAATSNNSHNNNNSRNSNNNRNNVNTAPSAGASEGNQTRYAMVPVTTVGSFLMCPLTKQPFIDPVVAADGYTYERQALTRYWLRNPKTSPMTSEKLKSTAVVPNGSIMLQLKFFTQNYDMSPEVMQSAIPTSLNALPYEVLELIFSYLPSNTLLLVSKVCSEWDRVSASNLLWRPHLMTDFNNTEKQIDDIENQSNNPFALRAHFCSLMSVAALAANTAKQPSEGPVRRGLHLLPLTVNSS